MKKKLPIICIIVILLSGVCVLCYPFFSSVVNNLQSRSQAEDYTKTVAVMKRDDVEELFEEAEEYNNSLTDAVVITDPFDEEAYKKIGEKYEEALNIDGNGLIGYIDIPKINVYLPIQHGTSSLVLAHSAGHLQNTSLPIGGESTHAVISAHSAYPGETFFDYLTDMEIGDEFYIHILDRTLKYEVDQIKVILPDETDDLKIIEGEDHVTLLTCTPYSINTHRLLVRGVRVEYDDTEYITTGASALSFRDYLYFLGYRIPYWLAASVLGGILLIILLVIFLAKRKSRKKKKQEKQKHLMEPEKETEKEVENDKE